MTTNHADGVARQGDVRQKGNIELRLASRAGAQLRCCASGHPTSNESPVGRLAWLNFSRHSLDATTQFASPGDALIIRTRSDSTVVPGMCGLCPLEIYTSGRAGVPPFMVGACSTGAVTF